MDIFSYAPGGFKGTVVSVEVDCRTGIPGLDIVGLPASEVKEARERARVAIKNCGFQLPPRRILISLSPADLQKSGNGFDLAIALAILLGTGQVDADTPSLLVLGELHLDGRVGGVRGVIAAVSEAQEAGIVDAIVPMANRSEAELVPGTRIHSVASLAELKHALAGLPRTSWATSQDTTARGPAPNSTPPEPAAGSTLRDYRQLRSHASLKRMLQIAAAGGHHVLLIGPPGVGKSAALDLFPTIMPPLTREELVEVTRVQSLAGLPVAPLSETWWRPFRNPHHNSSTEGLLGGGNPVRPGDVALAHRGALFLDEALEFRRPVLQGLREPMERGRIVISRAGRRFWFPADFQLLLAANPCPCGMLGRRDRQCLCSVSEVERYWKRLGGPLLDRIDLRMFVRAEAYYSDEATESSESLRNSIVRAARMTTGRRVFNRSLRGGEARRVCRLDAGSQALLSEMTKTFGFSTRAVISVLRVARTIADLAETAAVGEEQLLEAASYRKVGEDVPIWALPTLDPVS